MLNKEIREFKVKIKNGAVYGLFSKTNDPGMIECIGYAGFDYIILDLEHGPNSVETLQGLIRAAQVSNILPIVRVKENNDSIIGEVLDIGAAGIQVPQVKSRVDAQRVVNLARFAPDGMRGICRFVRAAQYSSMDRFEYFKAANEALVIIQLEGDEAINNLDEILDVKGIDIVFIGLYDLSQSLGIPGQINHPSVYKAMKKIINKCTDKGIYTGTFTDTIENVTKWKNSGVQYIAYSVDMGLFYDKCKQIISNIRNEN